MIDENEKSKLKAIPVNFQHDCYKDTNWRFWGYMHVVGEACRHLMTKDSVKMCYGISLFYVAADTAETLFKTSSILYTLDTLLWQSFATVIIPPYIVNRLCHFVYGATKRGKNGPLISTIAGLCAIPIIMSPIDDFVDLVMNTTFRPTLGIRRRQ